MKPLRVLVIEDMEDHALLIVRELAKGGFAPGFTRVETLAELETALVEHSWDAIISDFRLPGFNALDALRCVRAHGEDVPFILVSGVIGEEMAAEVMKAGAHGYIMKGNYARLAPTLERELREAAVRRERRDTAANLTRRREELEVLVRQKSADDVHCRFRLVARRLERGDRRGHGVGRAPLHWLGERVALGTDGIGSDMFEEGRAGFFRRREEELAVARTGMAMCGANITKIEQELKALKMRCRKFKHR